MHAYVLPKQALTCPLSMVSLVFRALRTSEAYRSNTATTHNRGTDSDECQCAHEEDSGPEASIESDADEVAPLCKFGRPCGVRLTDTSEDAIGRHLVLYHLQDFISSDEREA